MQDATLSLLLFSISIFFACWISDSKSRKQAIRVVIFAWLLLLPLQLLINAWMPFSVGDDYDYYYNASVLRSWRDLLTPYLLANRYGYTLYTQPGYALVLNTLNLAFAPDLAGFKAFNLFCFVLAVLVWARTVATLEGEIAARQYLLAGIALTPLWYYFFFLLKDIVIVLLMAIFVHGLVKAWKRPQSLFSWSLQLLAAIALIPFRQPMLIQAGAIFAFTMGMYFFTYGLRLRQLYRLLIIGTSLIFFLALVNIGEIDKLFGLKALTFESMTHTKANFSQESQINWKLFPILYFLTESSGLSLPAWRAMDWSWLRGILALPWIFLVLPLLPSSILWLMRRTPAEPQGSHPVSRRLNLRALATPWAVVVGFVVSSALISWSVGDTTRWRLADMPAWLAIALAGGRSLPRRKLFRIMSLSILIGVMMFCAYSLLVAT